MACPVLEESHPTVRRVANSGVLSGVQALSLLPNTKPVKVDVRCQCGRTRGIQADKLVPQFHAPRFLPSPNLLSNHEHRPSESRQVKKQRLWYSGQSIDRWVVYRGVFRCYVSENTRRPSPHVTAPRSECEAPPTTILERQEWVLFKSIIHTVCCTGHAQSTRQNNGAQA
jgi:hypothetical protein